MGVLWLDQLYGQAQSIAPIVFATGAAILVSVLVYRIHHAYYVSPLRQIPGSFLARTSKRYMELVNGVGYMAEFGRWEHEKYRAIFVGQPNSVCIADPADIRRVLSTPSFLKGTYYKILQFDGRDSIMSTRHPELVSKKRRMLGPYFSTSYLNKMEELILEYGTRAITNQWCALLEDQHNVRVNYCQTFSMCTFNIVSRLVFGQDIGVLDPHNNQAETFKWVTKATGYVQARALLQMLPRPLFLLATWPWEHLYQKITGYVYDSIDTRQDVLAGLEGGDSKPADLLQALMECADTQSRVHLEPEQIHAESLLLLIGGIDPTAYTLTWTLHLLLLYPECHRRVISEVRTAYPPTLGTNFEVTYSMARKLDYLEACILESLRLIPVPQVMIPRMVPDQGTTIKGHYLPPGTTVFINTMASHLSKTYWREPHRFWPDRFRDPENQRAAHNVFTFGYGNRLCLGKHLAMMNMMTIMANLLRRFDFALPPEYTRAGPTVIDPQTGYPKIMEVSHMLSAKPADEAQDCWIIVSKAKECV